MTFRLPWRCDATALDCGSHRLGGDLGGIQDRLTIRGEGGLVQLDAAGRSAQGKAIWVVAGRQTVIENIAFRGASVPDKNGAGIRQEGTGLTLRGCTFTGNENGLLAGENRASDIRIERSRFAGNGKGDGQTHNIYIGTVRSFTLVSSKITAARVGHEVKSRALRNDIRYNVIDDEQSTASYSIELPNGGDSRVVGNLIVQGPNSENTAIVSYGLEGLSNSGRQLWLVNNTIVNPFSGRSACRPEAAAGTH